MEIIKMTTLKINRKLFVLNDFQSVACCPTVDNNQCGTGAVAVRTDNVAASACKLETAGYCTAILLARQHATMLLPALRPCRCRPPLPYVISSTFSVRIPQSRNLRPAAVPLRRLPPLGLRPHADFRLVKHSTCGSVQVWSPVPRQSEIGLRLLQAAFRKHHRRVTAVLIFGFMMLGSSANGRSAPAGDGVDRRWHHRRMLLTDAASQLIALLVLLSAVLLLATAARILTALSPGAPARWLLR
ncbi:hypothetical protein ACKU5V_027425 [Klebsiella pneumoniae]